MAEGGIRPAWLNDLDAYQHYVREAARARDEYMGGRHGLEASGDWTPGSPHMEYHRTLTEKWDAGVRFHTLWGFWPDEQE